MGRPPGTQSAAGSRIPGVALGTVRGPRNLGPPQRANPLPPPFRTASSQGRSSPSQQADDGVLATTATESLCSIVPAAAAAPAVRPPPAPDGGGGAGCSIRRSARGAVQSVLRIGSFGSVSASSPVTKTLPSDPRADRLKAQCKRVSTRMPRRLSTISRSTSAMVLGIESKRGSCSLICRGFIYAKSLTLFQLRSSSSAEVVRDSARVLSSQHRDAGLPLLRQKR